MAKHSRSDSDAETEQIVSDSDDQSCASSSSLPPRKITSRRRPQKKKIKRDLDVPNDVTVAHLSLHAKSTHVIQYGDVASIRSSLLQWYAKVHTSRNMPWRKQYNPALGPDERAQRAYEVWISEIMLQQTQVATVIPYYNRWMEKFPNIRDLAAASIDEVNSLWKGLGYYSRASRLLAGAQKAAKEYNGRLPDNAKDMEANIPGIGRYSAGAICSIAYGENVPVLDGNVNRLLSRVLALHAPPKAKATLNILWGAATAMVQDLAGSTSAQYPGDVNQALIELGSTVCKVRDPGCDACPLRTWCAAYASTREKNSMTPEILVTDIEDLCKICEPLIDGASVTTYPMKADKKKAREELDIVNVVEWRSGSDRQFLLMRRPEGGLLAGLDEFPTSPNVAATSSARQLKIPLELLSVLLHHSVSIRDAQGKPSGPQVSPSPGLRITKVKPAGDVVHVFSHIKKTYRVQWVVLEGGESPPELAAKRAAQKSSATAKAAGKGKGKPGKPGKTAESGGVSMWVPLDEVATRNIGTGVLKVWNLARTLWEEQ
ncbi:DNA glycosylase [Mycena sp. CBHHK59/15]|nr:DNA glycosylase [Mycena sp. CBHHK59/15]